MTLQPLCLAGPTASGKTAAALAIAQRWPVEIISVDSALVYRGMDIGTAKPAAAERAAVPHHLINIRDPLQAYSAAEFVRDATRLITEIRARGARVAGLATLRVRLMEAQWLATLAQSELSDVEALQREPLRGPE